MKQKYFNSRHKALLIIPFLCVLMFASCKKYLDVQPVSGFTPNLTFDNVTDAQKAVWGVYQELAGSYGYGLNLSLYYPYDNDEMMGPGSSTGIGDGGKKDITHYNVNSGTNNAVLLYSFNQLYEGIERANNCILYIPTMTDFNSPGASDYKELHRLYGESLTLRAQFFFDLVKLWGDVPAEFVPSANLPSLFIPKTNRDTIYDHILGDLQVAENNVDWYYNINGGQTDGRFTQNAIRGLRARIALFRGGFSLRADGHMEQRSDWRTYYTIAKTECDTVIAEGLNSLNPNYKSIFINGICKGIGEPKEVLFQVGASPGQGQDGDSKLGIYDGPKSTINGTSSSGGVLVLPNYFYLFDSTDTRRDVACAPYTIGANSGGSIVLTGGKLTALYSGKFRRDWSANPMSTGQFLSENWPLLRYSDILLMDAEADNALNNGPSANAQSYLAKVMTRGHGGNVNLIGTVPTDYLGFFNAIIKERSLEFGGEGLRKYDLIRWDSLASKISETKIILASIDSVATKSSAYSAYTYNGHTVSQLPTTVYWATTSSPDSLQWSSYYYKQSQPPGFASIAWISTSIATTFNIVYAVGFVPNQSELYPFPEAAIAANPGNVTQNPGYQ